MQAFESADRIGRRFLLSQPQEPAHSGGVWSTQRRETRQTRKVEAQEGTMYCAPTREVSRGDSVELSSELADTYRSTTNLQTKM